MMIVSYGPYQFLTASPIVSIDRPPIINERAERLGYTEIWRLRGKLFSPIGDQNDLSNQLALLEAAFAIEGQDLVLSMPNGSPSQHALRSSKCLGGTRVTKCVSYPVGEGAEYATYRSYEVEVQGEVYDAAIASSLWSWSETLSITGTCGPILGWLVPKYGNAILQLFKSTSTCKAVQAGESKGLFDYFGPPSPIWPGYEVDPSNRELNPGTPRRFGTAYKLYPLSWKYYFEADVPLAGASPTNI